MDSELEFLLAFVQLSKGLGRIIAVTGPMFSGKTSYIIESANILYQCRVPVVLIAPSMSKRSPEHKDEIQSHSGLRPLVKTTYIDVNDLALVCDALLQNQEESPKVICIEEGQFFCDLLKVCCRLRSHGVSVIVAGLILTFERKPFGEMHALIDYCDSLIYKKAVCHFCRCINATLTKRLTNSKEEIVVGGKEDYAPVCQNCFRL